MQNQIDITTDAKIGDSTLVRDLTIKRGLNKGKGYSLTLVNQVKVGKRNNTEVSELFREVIENRNQLLK